MLPRARFSQPRNTCQALLGRWGSDRVWWTENVVIQASISSVVHIWLLSVRAASKHAISPAETAIIWPYCPIEMLVLPQYTVAPYERIHWRYDLLLPDVHLIASFGKPLEVTASLTKTTSYTSQKYPACPLASDRTDRADFRVLSSISGVAQKSADRVAKHIMSTRVIIEVEEILRYGPRVGYAAGEADDG
ncbi:uncharacterized protein LAESUDRAFT_715275 [Laetiporus sulphureus 93-53]|uniref:Uncharacterized protein n=1 Tax=Laetiporus sulphureus 93-53 TaxID=1314785 RepID=A0A165DJ19_9APHY|nr:uncharacterized protein LAESUDRAFT_715275 [Laetiporus sulphureus 93-53]KZT04991.1 hypothetical protein LAESUDRAFT_715275 [Laetiporus sulphureus 93-53]